jgi:hypothetical protein
MKNGGMEIDVESWLRDVSVIKDISEASITIVPFSLYFAVLCASPLGMKGKFGTQCEAQSTIWSSRVAENCYH